ncbi:hypothetical protein PAXRUDRAFT_20003 [Paxillus rubicundulus Ve08.2h10]|uniref:Uncharacterized protein n=1 Tax=Paxillus rubicundulus Ve08.2h10 TaxID=930991 RepID=A0A0D0CTG3_9AGAM|nr:hypothetical protein PAXRUDRAFT_20003 [Paxillus rubicundulus Ve08.2h10]
MTPSSSSSSGTCSNPIDVDAWDDFSNLPADELNNAMIGQNKNILESVLSDKELPLFPLTTLIATMHVTNVISSDTSTSIVHMEDHFSDPGDDVFDNSAIANMTDSPGADYREF